MDGIGIHYTLLVTCKLPLIYALVAHPPSRVLHITIGPASLAG